MRILRLVYSIIIFSFDKLSLCKEHTRLLRSQVENEIFYTLNIFNSSATSILDLQYDDIDFMFYFTFWRAGIRLFFELWREVFLKHVY